MKYFVFCLTALFSSNVLAEAASPTFAARYVFDCTYQYEDSDFEETKTFYVCPSRFEHNTIRLVDEVEKSLLFGIYIHPDFPEPSETEEINRFFDSAMNQWGVIRCQRTPIKGPLGLLARLRFRAPCNP